MALWAEILAKVAALQPECEQVKAAWKDGLALAGAGFHGGHAVHWLLQQGAALDCFIDNHPAKQGSVCEGLEVLSLEQFVQRDTKMVLITARHAVKAVQQQLQQAGIASLSYDAFFVCYHLERLQKVRDELLGDERSREIYDHLLLAMLTGDSKYCEAVNEGRQYFALPEFTDLEGEVFVDAGAYDGDTIVQFLQQNAGRFEHIYAFEPGPLQYEKMQERVRKLCEKWHIDQARIDVINAGVGAQDGISYFHQGEALLQSSTVREVAGEASSQIQIYALDSYLAGKRVSFLKADVEGMEMALLKGAKQLINQQQLKMALSLYHKAEDLYEIPEYIHHHWPQYQLSLRHHSPTLMESVLYAWH